MRPPNYYGKTKLLIEQYLKRKAFKLNLNINVFRFFNVVGAKKDLKYGLLNVKSNHLFQNICKSIIFNKIFQIYYNDLTKKSNDNGFIQLDNSLNSRKDWSEYWPIRNYFLMP